MDVVGVAVAFGSVMFLVSKGISLWLSLLLGTGILGLLSQMGLDTFATALVNGLVSPTTLQLALAVALLSGLGRTMKESGDLELMVNSLVALFPKPKVLTMLLPALIGTINVPGGAIMSAPMVEENGKALGLDKPTQSAVNLFFRHIGFYVYPLQTSLILLSEVLGVSKQSIIRYNVLPTLVGLAVAYLYFLRGQTVEVSIPKREKGIAFYLKGFFLGFSPILLILCLVLMFNIPFHWASAAGLLLAAARNISGERKASAFVQRLKQLVTKWINYKLALAILSLMLFKSVVEACGITTTLTSAFLKYGIPLPILVVVLGFLTAYIFGTHLAASGLLAPLFAPLLPEAALGQYTALMLVAIMLGYQLSPLHLCLVLTNQHFGVSYGQTVKKLAVPLLAIVVAMAVQVLLLL